MSIRHQKLHLAVQSVVFKKPAFPDTDTCVAYLASHGFKVPKKVDETDSQFRYRQVMPIEDAEYRTIQSPDDENVLLVIRAQYKRIVQSVA